eukprot:1136450-Pelagomonas_calceolata.AAC.2
MSTRLLQRVVFNGSFLRAAESRVLAAGLQQAPSPGPQQPPLQQQPYHTAASSAASLSSPSFATWSSLSSLHPIAFGNILSHQARCLLLTSTLGK